jgi:hypothetical protein
MEKDAEKYKFTIEYLEGLRNLPDNDFAIPNYHALHNSAVLSLFGSWKNFDVYSNNYEKSQNQPELSKPNSLEFMTQNSEILFKNNGNFTQDELTKMNSIVEENYLKKLDQSRSMKDDVILTLRTLESNGFVALPKDLEKYGLSKIMAYYGVIRKKMNPNWPKR